MRKLLTLSLIAAAIGGGFAAVHGDYSAVAREMQIQRTPSAEILKQHAMYQASAARAQDQPLLPERLGRRDEPVAYYFTTTIG